MLITKHQRGDTIVEVIFAFSIFAMIAVGGLSLMNQGTATAQRTLEITLVRQQIDAQADLLRMINREVIAGVASKEFKNSWDKIKATNSTSRAELDQISSSQGCKKPDSGFENSAFVINPAKISSFSDINSSDSPIITIFNNAITYAKIETDDPNNSNNRTFFEPQGIWIMTEKVTDANNADYFNFHIRACWTSPGQSTPMTLGTIVRLYDASI